MLYVQNLTTQDYLDTGKLLNLVLDQKDRKKDLFFKVEIYSTINFNSIRLGKKYLYKQEVQVPLIQINGGKPSCPFFFKNPQFLVKVDPNKFVDKQKLISTQVDVMLTY
jgi:hypothetical protein